MLTWNENAARREGLQGHIVHTEFHIMSTLLCQTLNYEV
jgi:hypothetical protein